MFEVILFSKDSEVVECKEFENQIAAEVAIAIAEECEEFDHGYLLNVNQATIVYKFGYENNESLPDEVAIDTNRKSYDL